MKLVFVFSHIQQLQCRVILFLPFYEYLNLIRNLSNLSFYLHLTVDRYPRALFEVNPLLFEFLILFGMNRAPCLSAVDLLLQYSLLILPYARHVFPTCILHLSSMQLQQQFAKLLQQVQQLQRSWLQINLRHIWPNIQKQSTNRQMHRLASLICFSSERRE